jgi:hypothetical protein
MYRFSRLDAKNVLATVKVPFEELPSVRMVKSYLCPFLLVLPSARAAAAAIHPHSRVFRGVPPPVTRLQCAAAAMRGWMEPVPFAFGATSNVGGLQQFVLASSSSSSRPPLLQFPSSIGALPILIGHLPCQRLKDWFSPSFIRYLLLAESLRRDQERCHYPRVPIISGAVLSNH